jgi:hypothetical protein
MEFKNHLGTDCTPSIPETNQGLSTISAFVNKSFSFIIFLDLKKY